MSYNAGNLSIEFLGIDKTASATLDNIIARLERLEKITANFGKTRNRNSKRSGGGFSFLKIASWTATFAVARRFGRVVNNIAQAGADYTETLNLWQVAMGSNLDVASEFVNKMNEAYGISEKTLMNAQAIFKNMLGSLGEISDTMAYALSEGITQMALDYASLYNVTFENAFTKFQAALAGQVRPIRSVSGYDITENTLFQLYQLLGGTKTMRQLSRTEKQLLSIFAVFRQMDASGAVGDLEKTMGSFANQSRVWAESLNEVKTWLGVIITYTIQESGIMIKFNAILITVARYLEAVARDMGAIQSFGGADPFAGTEQSAENALDAVEELNGKLLDFDKFRSLSGSEENALGLDKKLLSALSGYDTILGNASLKARELSDQYLKALGFAIDTNGELILTNDQLDEAKDKIGSIIRFFSEFDGLTFIKQATPFLTSLLSTLTSLLPIITSISTASAPIVTGIIQAFGWIVDLLDKLGLLKAVIVTIISYKLANRILSIGTNLGNMNTTFLQPFIAKLQNLQLQGALATTTFQKFQIVMGYVGVAAMTAFASFTLFDSIISSLDGNAKRTVSIISIVIGALGTVLGLILAIKGGLKGGLLGASIAGLGVGALIAGIKGISSKEAQSLNNIPNYEMGASDIDSGTIFRAGEFGKTEAVYTGSNGKTNVANIQQMKTAYNQALNEWWQSARKDIPVFQGVSDSGIYTIVDSEARRRGKTFSNKA